MSDTNKTNTAPDAEKKTVEIIIVAEDSLPNQKILQHLITKLGYKAIACNNGQIAWDALNEPNVQNVVAVLSDMMMPEMDGLTLLKKIREDEKFKKLPFVLITAVSEKEQIIAAKSLNVNGYILKPVTFQKVISKLKELFPNKKFPNLAA
jgi:CheY-like chemotaxis protein